MWRRRCSARPCACAGSAYNFALLRGQLAHQFRLYENWSGRTHTQTGSIVQLAYSVHSPDAPGPTGCTNPNNNNIGIYNGPTRVQDYDEDFDTFNRLPPLTPRFVSVRQLLFTQKFK